MTKPPTTDTPAEPELKRVKLVPLKSTWTCPQCRYQNTITAYSMGDQTSVCGFCMTHVLIGELRASDATPTTAPLDAPKRAQEIVGNIHNYYDDERGELAWSAFANLTRRIASALTATPTQPETPDPAAERVAKEIVRTCILDAKRVPCDCEELWCHHWEDKVASRITAALTARDRIRDERAARIAEAMAMGETYETGRQKAINIAAAIRSKESTDGR